MTRAALVALLVIAAGSADADGERWSMIPACEWAVRIVGFPRGYRLLHAAEDFTSGRATIEYESRDDHGTFVHHSAYCNFWHRRLSTMSIDNDAQGQIIVD